MRRDRINSCIEAAQIHAGEAIPAAGIQTPKLEKADILEIDRGFSETAAAAQDLGSTESPL